METTPQLKGPRSGVRMFVKDPPGLPKGWHAMPFQVDPVDADGHLIFFKDEAFKKQEVDKSDYMTFRVEHFGVKADLSKEKLPCRGPVVFELWDDRTQRYAYVTSCGATAPEVSHPPAVSFTKAEHRLESQVYRYRFNPQNYMQFDEISFKNATGAWDLVAKDSRMVIRSDVKNFFTMSFDTDDIVSRLEESRLGPVGDLARLSFFLKILFFKIKMSLSTDVGFYADSGHIPMMVSLPVNSYEYLHPRSGILYSWELTPFAKTGAKEVHMPLLDVELVKKGFKDLAKAGLKFCNGWDCNYKYNVDLGERRLAMDLAIRKSLVEKGFFPIFVEDVEAYREAMGWEVAKQPAGTRMGMYFEVSGLPKGGHPWDFWLRLGGAKDTARTCPAPVRIAKVVSITP